MHLFRHGEIKVISFRNQSDMLNIINYLKLFIFLKTDIISPEDSLMNNKKEKI